MKLRMLSTRRKLKTEHTDIECLFHICKNAYNWKIHITFDAWNWKTNNVS